MRTYPYRETSDLVWKKIHEMEEVQETRNNNPEFYQPMAAVEVLNQLVEAGYTSISRMDGACLSMQEAYCRLSGKEKELKRILGTRKYRAMTPQLKKHLLSGARMACSHANQPGAGVNYIHSYTKDRYKPESVQKTVKKHQKSCKVCNGHLSD